MMKLLMLLVFMLPALVIIYRAMIAPRERRGIFLYALTLYAATFAQLKVFAFGLTPANILASTAVTLELVAALRSRRRLASMNGLDLGVIVLVGWLILNTAVQGQVGPSLRNGLVTALVILATKLRPQTDARDLRILMTTMAVGACIVAFSMWVQRYWSASLFGLGVTPTTFASVAMARLTGVARNPNGTAVFLLFGCASVCGGLAWPSTISRRFQRTSEILLLSTLGYAMLFTQSRSGFIAYLVIISLRLGYLFHVPRTLVFLLGGLMFLAFVSDQLDFIQSYMDQALFPDRPTMALSGRGDRIRVAVAVMENSPWFGDTTVEHRHGAMHYHNSLLIYAATTGVVAGLGFLGMLVAPLVRTLSQILRPDATPLAVAASCFVISMILNDMVHAVLSSSISYWLMAGFFMNSKALFERESSVPARSRPTS